MTEKKESTSEESSLTIKVGVVVVLVLGFFGWLFQSSLSHESRIAKMETKLEIHIPQIKTTLDDLNKVTKEIREDQIRRQRKER